MTAYAIDWEGAYDAWKQSGLPRRRFKYSEQFKSFIGEGGMQSEDTVRTRFRSIRDQRGDRYVAAVNSETEQRPVELDLSEPVKIFRLNEEKIQNLANDLVPKQENHRQDDLGQRQGQLPADPQT